jgi:hypothetical protein
VGFPLVQADPSRASIIRRRRTSGGQRRFTRGRTIGFVSQKSRSWLSSLLLRRLSKADTWAATILVDELDAGGFESTADRVIVSRRH